MLFTVRVYMPLDLYICVIPLVSGMQILLLIWPYSFDINISLCFALHSHCTVLLYTMYGPMGRGKDGWGREDDRHGARCGG